MFLITDTMVDKVRLKTSDSHLKLAINAKKFWSLLTATSPAVLTVWKINFLS